MKLPVRSAFIALLLAVLLFGLLPVTALAASPSDLVIGNSYTLENGQILIDDLVIRVLKSEENYTQVKILHISFSPVGCKSPTGIIIPTFYYVGLDFSCVSFSGLWWPWWQPCFYQII